MGGLAIAIDLGTSGFRAQAIDLSSGKIISTVITQNHPLPGINVMDHIHFALELGVETACSIIIKAINKIIKELPVERKKTVRLAVCGNPAQLSLFQGKEIRDLAYGGKKKLRTLGVNVQERKGAVIAASDIQMLELPGTCEVIIPPSVCQEVGADALAMIIKSGMMETPDTSIAIDFGTNAEMAISHKGHIITGSAAAGSAIEGQHITCGMVAAPGAIADIGREYPYYRTILLDSSLNPVHGPLVDLAGTVIEKDNTPEPAGITGTGTIGTIALAMETGLITLPHIKNGKLRFNEKIFLSEEDLMETGRAIGAIRAGYMTLCMEGGIKPEELHTVYMAGASGTYIDAVKAQKIGIIPPEGKHIYQIGNTSLAMARELATDPGKLDYMISIADKLRKTYSMFASSNNFKKLYILELSYWTEGMPLNQYRKFLQKYRFPDLPEVNRAEKIIRTMKRDIDEPGEMGLKTITGISGGIKKSIKDCKYCMKCIKNCKTKALKYIDNGIFTLEEALCAGINCKICEYVCPEKIFKWNNFFDDYKKF